MEAIEARRPDAICDGEGWFTFIGIMEHIEPCGKSIPGNSMLPYHPLIR